MYGSSLFPLASVKAWFLSSSYITPNSSLISSSNFSSSFFYFIRCMNFGALVGFHSLWSYRVGSRIFRSKFVGSGIQGWVFVIRFFLKGLGYKFVRPRSTDRMRALRVELGFSVVNYFAVPTGVRVFGRKNRFVFVGVNNKALLKKFCGMIYKLRPEDIYKGKGVRTSLVTTKVFKSGKQRLFCFFFTTKLGIFVILHTVLIYKMNLIFGKSQVAIQQFRYRNFEVSFSEIGGFKPLSTSFVAVYGFGRRRADWFSSAAGFSSSNIRMPFVFSNRFVDREFMMSDLFFAQPLRRLVGKELFVLVDKYKENRSNYGSFKLSPKKIKNSKKGGKKSKKLFL